MAGSAPPLQGRHADDFAGHAAAGLRMREDQLRSAGDGRRYRSDQRSYPAVPLTGLRVLVRQAAVGAIKNHKLPRLLKWVARRRDTSIVTSSCKIRSSPPASRSEERRVGK